MKKLMFLIAFTGLTYFSFSQVKSLNSTEKPKEHIGNSTAKPLSQSESKPGSKIQVKRKIKEFPIKESYEISPRKD